jgi:DNA-binding HxlR family transcriptional regulator
VSGYGQFCPVSKAMELLNERWTMLVVRELPLGSRHFNELRRGVPRMSPALLSKRLRALTRAGVVERRDDGPRVTYALTEAGEELRPIVEALGAWASAGSRSWARRTSTRACCSGTCAATSTCRWCPRAARWSGSTSPTAGSRPASGGC